MCGIAGIFKQTESADIEQNEIQSMVSMLNHRGPDESGIYLDSKIALGHTRLSIIGLDDGSQPMSNEDGSLWIVYNGEAFNYLELKAGLVQKGHRFRTTTDTEVVLHLFEEYGPSCLEKINGQFALAIWNSKNHTLFLARDRVGIRPLFYCQVDGRFFFASEIKAIFACPQVPRELELTALSQVFTFWTTLNHQSVFKGIKELPPGHYLTLGAGAEKPKPYWELPYYPQGERWMGTEEEACEELSYLLKDAIRLRLRADVPVGAYLSGGLDSSIITSLISGHFNNKLRTFSLSFEEKAFDETIYQTQMVESLKTDHRQILARNDHIQALLPKVVWHSEKPLLRMGPVPLFLLSGLVKENGFKVVLTGEGADEIFGGYNIFKEAKVRAFWAKERGSRSRPLLLQRLYPYIFTNPSRTKFLLEKFFSVQGESALDPFFSHRVRWDGGSKNLKFLSKEAQACLADYDPIHALAETLPDDFNKRDLLSRAQYLEIQLFLSNYLLSSQGDRVGMGNSIELRLPFLDYRLIDFSMRLPPHWKIKGLNEKYILKKAFAVILPREILDRPKQPYRAPIHQSFFSSRDNDYLEEILSFEKVARSGYFDPLKVRNLVDKYRKPANIPSESQNMALMAILTTHMIDQQFIGTDQFCNREITKPSRIVCRKVVGG